ncbi:MAG: HAMP domain-containing histidine kinase [Anaerolineae bacterium]|nr:HAMP domain-containing histidine kinase [Anaerolineae bacterium]
MKSGFLSSLLFRTNILRACLETAPVTLVFPLVLRWIFGPVLPMSVVDASMIIVAIAGPLWCAVRIRAATGVWWKQIAKEIGIILAASLLLFGFFVIAACLYFPTEAAQWPILLLSLVLVGALAILRTSMRFLRFWSRKRRKSFAANLSNSILLPILIVSVGLTAVLTMGTMANAKLSSAGPAEWIAGNLTVFLARWIELTIVGGAIVLLCLPPPTLLFSYWVARRFTKRVTALAQATGEMCKGDYSARVAVEGEDEVARLQSDFNAMASDLDHTVHELQTERDRVAGVLQSRRELVAGVSHDLRTPVATIRAHLESVRDVKSIASFEAELEILNCEVIRLQSLIDDLFTLSQAEVNKLTLNVKPVDASAVVREQVAAMAPLAWQSGRVQVTAEVAEDVPPAIADCLRFERALTNLIHNAARHTPPGGVVLVGVSAEADAVRIDVRDTGEGIAPEDLPQIWDRYYQGKNGSENLGVGLGLALVKEFAEAMGGTVAVESELGRGSCFTIRLRRR